MQKRKNTLTGIDSKTLKDNSKKGISHLILIGGKIIMKEVTTITTEEMSGEVGGSLGCILACVTLCLVAAPMAAMGVATEAI